MMILRALIALGVATSVAVPAMMFRDIRQDQTRIVEPQIAVRPAATVEPTQVGDRITYPAGRYPVLALPNGEKRRVRSLLNIDRQLNFGDFEWNDTGVPAGPVWVRVDLALQTISVFRSEHEIGSALILYGADGKPTPPGVYPIMQRAKQHRSTLYDAEMPYMLRLTGDGIAIHASNVRASAATHGCVGVPLEFARLLFDQVKRGDRVVIIGVPPKRARRAA